MACQINSITKQILQIISKQQKAKKEKRRLCVIKSKARRTNLFGFGEGFCTEHVIVDIVSAIQSNMDKPLFTCGIFIDLKKAFDTVNHQILLNKLNHYGFRGIVNNWFENFLKTLT